MTSKREPRPGPALDAVSGPPGAATVWGVQLRLDNANDPRLLSFITKYSDATQAPEPRGECTGGTGTPQG